MSEILLHDGEDDYITDTGLELLLQLSEKLPSGFDVGSANAHEGSVTVTFEFPGNGPMTQLEHLDNLLTASQFVGALARNLKHERAASAEADVSTPEGDE